MKPADPVAMDGHSRLTRFLNPLRSPKDKHTWLNPEQSTGDQLGKLGGYCCWDATGEARRQFELLSKELKDYYEKHCEPIPASGNTVTWTIWMVGPRREKSRPTVMFCCKDKATRSRIRTYIDESGIMEKYPGIRTGGCSEDFIRLASKDIDIPSNINTGEVEEILFSPSETDSGGQLLIKIHRGDVLLSRKARAGGIIRHGERYFIQTAAHAFEDHVKYATSPDPTSNSDLEFELDPFSDTEEDDIENSSRGSITPDYLISTDSPRSNGISSGISTPSRVSSHELDNLDNLIDDTNEGKGNEESNVENPRIGGPEAVLTQSSPLIPLGTIIISSIDGTQPGLDYALIEITQQQALLNDCSRNVRRFDSSSAMEQNIGTEPRDVDAIAIIGVNKTLQGRLSGTRTFMSLPSSRSVQEVWRFHHNGTLSNGDCGSWVTDTEKGDIFGHIVAGSPNWDIAYIIPSYLVIKELKSRFGGAWSICTGKTAAFERTTRQSEPYSSERMNGIHDQKSNDELEKSRDLRMQISSINLISISETPALPMDRSTLSVPSNGEPLIPKNLWIYPADYPEESNIDSPLSRTFTSSPQLPSRDGSPPSNRRDQLLLSQISKEAVDYRLSGNEEFLERRQQSRILIQKDLRESVSSIEEYEASRTSDNGPILSSLSPGKSPMLSTPIEQDETNGSSSNVSVVTLPFLEDAWSPDSSVDGRISRTSGSGYDGLMTRQRSHGITSQNSMETRKVYMRANVVLGTAPEQKAKSNNQSSFAIASTANKFSNLSFDDSTSRDFSRSRSLPRTRSDSIGQSSAVGLNREHINQGSGTEAKEISRGHSRNRSGKSSGSLQGSKQPSQKAMLSKALQKANTAVLLDNAQNFKEAKQAYLEACALLQHIILRNSGDDDRRKLEAIVSCKNR